MPFLRTTIRFAASLAGCAVAAAAQDAAIPPIVVHHARPAAAKATGSGFNPNLIVIDPAHGGADSGGTLAGQVAEKNVTLALAQRLRTLLAAKGFTVVLTRENSADDVPVDARIELANRSRPLACLLLHAASGGHGVHLFTSALAAPAPVAQGQDAPIAPWDTAQAPFVAQSLRLVNDVSQALNGIRVPLVSARSSVRPMDSLTCPAVAVELAPLAPNGDINTPVDDANYQQHVAEALTQAMVFWRGHAETMTSAPGPTPAGAAPAAPATKPVAKPKPKPIVPPLEVPDEVTPEPVRRPAPIVRPRAEPVPSAPPTALNPGAAR